MKSLFFSLFAGASLATKADGKCYALAFSSGDEDAAYQAGVIKGITTNPKLTPDEWAYDSVSGISAGALNAVLLSSYPKGQEHAAVERMEQFWKDATKNKLYKNWFGGIARGLFYEGGLYDSTPMEDFLKKEFNNTKIERALNLGIVNVEDGTYHDFSDKNITSSDNLVDSLYASMSFVGFFAPAKVLGADYFDGAALSALDIFDAVNRCSEKGFANEDIVLDVVLTTAANLKPKEVTKDYKTLGVVFRYLEVAAFYQAMDGFLRAKFAYTGVNFRYIIAPSGHIPSSIRPLKMSEREVEAAIAMGVSDANSAIEIGVEATIENIKCLLVS